MVTNHLHNDLETLSALLFVDRFFFKAAVPHIYWDPFRFVQHESQNQLISLIIASTIHTQRRFSQFRHSTSYEQSFTAARFLTLFQLDLVDPLPPLLQDATTGASPTTVDYARFIGVELPWNTTCHNIDAILHIAPDWALEPHTTVFDIHGETIEIEAGLINRTTRGIPGPMDDSRAFIWARLGAMLLQCYPENLHKITFDICDARRYLPLTDRLEKLGTVFLHYFRGMTDGHVQDTVSFLSTNRIAYPRKKPVQIEFGVEWDAPWNQKHASERQRHQSWIKLIKAVGHPVQIDASRSPGFYEDILEGIELDALETFVDTDRYRGSLPSRFQKLDLRLSTVINVLKDVFAAYAQSLKEIDLFMRMTAAYCSTSEQLIFGDWNLPWVRAINISFPPRSLVCVGDFSDCPVLEILSLVPSSYPGSSRFSNDVHRVAPVWKLSRIKSLRLVGVAALQFDFDSLDHCTDLETLILECNSEFGRLMPIGGAPDLVQYNIRTQTSDCSNTDALDPPNHRCNGHWRLPKLRTLILDGPPSSKFSLEWLDRCVVLKYLQLTAHDLIGSNILLCSKDDSTATAIVSSTETQTAALNTQPQTESKLKSIVLKGCWRIPLDVLTSLVTDYAPNVTALRVERIEDDPDLVGPGGTQYGLRSSGVGRQEWPWGNNNNNNNNNNTTTPAATSGVKLRSFSCAYTLSRSDKKELGMSGLDYDQAYWYRQAGKLVVMMGHQHYIRKEDKS
ncbi:hypothetical protein BGZ74_011140 [Mortierella antarctica]|nr:hypothetical protein BGZ74_011140 [Mortierella antarctica]